MSRQTIVVLLSDATIEAHGSLKRACNAHPEFKYWTISRLRYPFRYKGWTFYRVKFNEKCINNK